MGDLNWRLENGTYNALAVRHAAGEFRGPIARCADTADIIQALKANPEACAEVKAALLPLTMAGANATHDRAEQAERDLADALTLAEERLCATRQAERERDEARAEVSEWHALSEAVGFAHEPDTGPVVVDAAAREAFAEWTVRARRAESDAFELTVERDALNAKLAEAEARCSALARSDIQSAALARLRQEEIVGLHAKHDLYRRDVENTWFAKTQAAESRASAAEEKLAEAEREVEGAESMREDALRQLEMAREVARLGRIEAENGRKSAKRYQGERDEAKAIAGDLRSRLTAAEKFVAAANDELAKALESANGLDQKRNGRSCVSFGRLFPEDTYPTTEPEADAFVKSRMRLWLHTWVTAPMRRAIDALDAAQAKDSDSPVGVAATACEHKRQRCENDHAVCRDCGAVNRAVTGVEDWAPPRVDPADLTEEPLTRADLDALEERIVERVARACERSSRDPHGYYPGNVVLADELRRKP